MKQFIVWHRFHGHKIIGNTWADSHMKMCVPCRSRWYIGGGLLNRWIDYIPGSICE